MAMLPYQCRAVAKVGADARAVMAQGRAAQIPAASAVGRVVEARYGGAVVVLTVSQVEAARKLVV